jgi:serine/threonine protein kinase
MPQQQKQLGKGGYSTVSRSTSMIPGVVVKRINPSRENISSLIAKYTRQKKVLDNLQQRNPTRSQLFNKIYKITDKNQSIMKDLGDKDLWWYMKNGHHRLLDDLDNVVGQLKDAVVIMLMSRVVHRDIKPENIMAQYDTQTGKFYLTLIDFTDSLTAEDIKKSKKFSGFGTPYYKSPELISRDARKNWSKGHPNEYIANDLWSLGIVLYELIYRKNPIEIFEKQNPNFKTGSLHQFYQFLKKNPFLYDNLFPDFNPRDPRYKHVNDVRTLLSLNPDERIWWLNQEISLHSLLSMNPDKTLLLLKASDKIQKQKISRLLDESELLKKRKKTSSSSAKQQQQQKRKKTERNKLK